MKQVGGDSPSHRGLPGVFLCFIPESEWKMPRSFLVKSKKAHTYHQHRCVEDDLPVLTWAPVTSAFTGESIHPLGLQEHTEVNQ